MFHEIYKNKKILITGHTGFKGSWLALWLSKIGAKIAGYSLAPEKLSHFNLLNLPIKNYFGDINDAKFLKNAFKEFSPDIVFHLAAQPLVRDSYDDPVGTYTTNVIGSMNVYLAALNANVKSLVSITTDKVYENKEHLIGYCESDRLGGHDPYSSSKASVEIMTDSFRKSFLIDGRMLLATARAGNVIGGGDWARDRLIPDLVRNASMGIKTAIRNPHSIRPWQHVLEPLHGYLLLGEKLIQGNEKFSTSFNFGPKEEGEATVSVVCELAKKKWDKIDINLIPDISNKHEANLLKLNTTKAESMLKWKATLTHEEAMDLTIDWYSSFYTDGKIKSFQDLEYFIRKINYSEQV